MDVLDHDRWNGGHCRNSTPRRVLQQGRNPVARVPGELDLLADRPFHRVPDFVLHVPLVVYDVYWFISRDH